MAEMEADYARLEEEAAALKKTQHELQRRADRAEHETAHTKDAMRGAVDERNLRLQQLTDRVAHLDKELARLQVPPSALSL